MFDTNPAHLFTLTELLNVEPPREVLDFADFWQKRYQIAIDVDSSPRLSLFNDDKHPEFDCFNLSYQSTDNFEISGWVLAPKNTPVTRGIVVGHGYGGREHPDFHLPVSGAVFFFPCFRGLSRSRHPSISEQPSFHVIHNVKQRDDYILRGCVDDLWLAVSALLQLFPEAVGHIGYMGISFGGGVGALALPWDNRIQRAHLNVPSFGNHPLRLQLPTIGSAAALQEFQNKNGSVLDTLAYYDAAVAANHVEVPIHIAAALADAVVTPPGQFSIYNALRKEKQLFVLDMGHSDYARKAEQELALLSELQSFFSTL